MIKLTTACLEPDCSSKVHCKGRCRKCYSRVYNRAYRESRKDKLNAISRDYYQANKGVIKAYLKKYVEDNKDALKERAKIYARTVERRYENAKKRAAARSKSWEMSFEEYRRVLGTSGCHYCGGVLPEAGSGLDRKNNATGYSIQNVVPCCRRCNDMKGPHLTYEEMLNIWTLRKRAA